MEETDPCDCTDCKAMCARPGWPTPQEAARMLDKGVDLMCDWWETADGPVYVICPASEGRAGKMARNWPLAKHPCVMQDADGLCRLHGTDHKPIECRVQSTHVDKPDVHEKVYRMWDTPEGREVVQRWRDEHD